MCKIRYKMFCILECLQWLYRTHCAYKGKKEDKDQESIQSSTTPEPGCQWESNNFTIRQHKREPRGQPFPACYHKAFINKRAQKHKKQGRNNINDTQKKHRLRTVSKKYFT